MAKNKHKQLNSPKLILDKKKHEPVTIIGQSRRWAHATIWIGLLMVLTGTFSMHSSPTTKLLSVTERKPANEIMAQLVKLSEDGFEKEAGMIAQQLLDEVDVASSNTPLPWKRTQEFYEELQDNEAKLSIQPSAFELWKRKLELLEALNRSREAGLLRSQMNLWLYKNSIYSD